MSALLDACARVRDSVSLSAIVARSIKLHRAGREWKASCPFHPDRTPSFTIYADDRRFCCFGCGAQGDQLDYLQRAYGTDLRGALEMVDAGSFASLPPRAREQRQNSTSSEAAAAIWRAAGPIGGTPAEAYLRARGLTLSLPPTLRFARLRPPKDSGVAHASGPDPLPALVSLMTDPGGKGLGIQRTFLTAEGAKATAADRKVKFSLGRVRGGAIHLAPAAAELVVTEGLEDGLTLAQELRMPVWVAAGSSMLPGMIFPDVVRSVVIGADADEAGRVAATHAGRAFEDQGLSARIMLPPAGAKDFNAALMGGLDDRLPG